VVKVKLSELNLILEEIRKLQKYCLEIDREDLAEKLEEVYNELI